MSMGRMNTGWLAQLAPEHPPTNPSWWPPAPGWWVSSVLLLALIAAGIAWWRNPRRRLRRAALRELRRINITDADLGQTARAVQDLLRRYALAAFGHERVARLSGEAWLRFVAARGAEGLAGPLGQSLLSASFSGKITDRQYRDRDAWCAAAEQFLRRAVRRDRHGAKS
jgi:hypothetical protein